MAAKKVVSVFTKKSTAIIHRLIAVMAIPENIEFYDQNSVVRYKDTFHPECGTECCLMGWMYWNEQGPKAYQSLLSKSPRLHDALLEINNWSETQLVLKSGEAYVGSLFANASLWPQQFMANYYRSLGNKLAMSKVVVSRLEHLLKTGE